MNPIKLIFRLLDEFQLLDKEDYARYREEARNWWDEIRTDDDVKEKDRDWRFHLKKKLSVWYVAVGVACLYFPVKRWLSDMVSDEPEFDDHN